MSFSTQAWGTQVYALFSKSVLDSSCLQCTQSDPSRAGSGCSAPRQTTHKSCVSPPVM